MPVTTDQLYALFETHRREQKQDILELERKMTGGLTQLRESVEGEFRRIAEGHAAHYGELHREIHGVSGQNGLKSRLGRLEERFAIGHSLQAGYTTLIAAVAGLLEYLRLRT